MEVHLRNVQMAHGVDPDAIAGITPGFTGADLANLVNEAALLATRRKDMEDGVKLLLENETLTAEEFAPQRPNAATPENRAA